MLKELKTRLADESGVMPIIEATFVFPIMFFVIFFLFFMGNMYVSKSYTDNLVSEAAIRYAAQCADPNLTLINDDNKLPDTGLKNEPYRYLFNAFGSSGSIEDAVSACETYIKDGGSSFLSFFKGMEPQIKSVDVKFNNNLVNYSLSVTAEYKISLPWKFIFQDEIEVYSFTAHAEVPVSDAPEFIRNIDMAVDYLQQSETVNKFTEKISSLFNKDKIKNLE